MDAPPIDTIFAPRVAVVSAMDIAVGVVTVGVNTTGFRVTSDIEARLVEKVTLGRVVPADAKAFEATPEDTPAVASPCSV
jgi:hypothetical protein